VQAGAPADFTGFGKSSPSFASSYAFGSQKKTKFTPVNALKIAAHELCGLAPDRTGEFGADVQARILSLFQLFALPR
jgi:hypothetical protein